MPRTSTNSSFSGLTISFGSFIRNPLSISVYGPQIKAAPLFFKNPFLVYTLLQENAREFSFYWKETKKRSVSQKNTQKSLAIPVFFPFLLVENYGIITSRAFALGQMRSAQGAEPGVTARIENIVSPSGFAWSKAAAADCRLSKPSVLADAV